MLYAVLFEDASEADPDLRKTHMSMHLAFLEATPQILSAGPLSDEDGGVNGGLWLVEAQDEAEVRTLVETDPFWPTGLRKSVTIRHWRRVYADGRRLI